MSVAKKNLRAAARVKRRGLARPGSGEILREIFLAAPIPRFPGMVIGGYWPLGGEIDPRPLLLALAGEGMRPALPVVAGPDRPLIFRRWSPGERLEAGPHGTQAPPPEAPELQPDLLLVPLLAFDSAFRRLGQGGGYYDRTISVLRVPAVGLAYVGQEVDEVPHEAHDARLDWIVTEAWARRREA